MENRTISTIKIPLTPTVKSIQTRSALIDVPPKRGQYGAYNLGDLLWVKVPGYPHWPAMISRDPLDGRFARSTATGFVYHVQYFGEATRNWVQSGKFWPFEGPQLVLPDTKKAITPKSRYKGHDKAVEEAIQASKMEPAERIKRLTFNYILVDPKASSNIPKTPTSAKKKKTPLKSKSKTKTKSADESVYDFDESIEDIEQDEKPELVWSRPREPTPPPLNDTINNAPSEASSDSPSPDINHDVEPSVSPAVSADVTPETTPKDESSEITSDVTFDIATQEPVCFVCKSANDKCVKCCQKTCDKYYHLSCLEPQSFPFNYKSGKDLICPLHYCLTCYTDLPYPRDTDCLKMSKRTLIKCSSCPTAFHHDDDCMAPGTSILDNNNAQCPAHRSTKNEKHINVSWCFSCNEAGKLICCESCPAAFHAECIDNAPKKDEQYFCYDCHNRKQLHYGDIIWIKLGAYRWWPAKISYPGDVPENIMNLSHEEGDFPVYFFGSHDYYWSHRGRVFVFVEEDGELKCKSGSSDKKYKAALEEARLEYANRKTTEAARMQKITNGDKPRFKLIKQNRPINNVSQSTQDDLLMSFKQKCDCKPEGKVHCDTDDCLNRIMMIECDPDICPVGNKCKNQRFKKRQYPVCVPFKTDDVGWGLRTTEDIKKGDFVIEYVGELIDEAECNRRMEAKIEKGDTTFYFLTIDKDRIIDAGPSANHARFMNHSCQPNCETQKWVVNGQTKVGLFAICDIDAGTELTFNYNLDCRGNELLKCRCNSENCSGFIGIPPKNGKKVTKQ